MNSCPECLGELLPRTTMEGFSACVRCGKLVVTPKDDEAEPGLATGPVAIPDYHEAMIGWRAWGIDPETPEGQPSLLQSVTHTTKFWTPRKVTEAICDRSDSCKVPGDACSCGLYSAKTREHLLSMNYHQYDADRLGLFHVVGSVNIWGKVVEGSQGWRSQFGYPRELFLPYEAWRLHEGLSEAYGVPVRLQNILSEMQQEV